MACLLGLAGCDRRAASADGPPTVVVSIPPLISLVEPLLADGVRVVSLVPPGQSVHGFEPAPEQLALLGRAEAIVVVGMGIEERVGTFIQRSTFLSNKTLEMAQLAGVDTSGGPAHHHGHDHGPDTSCAHGPDAHLWVDPELARRFVRALPEYLPRELLGDPGVAEALVERIDVVDRAYANQLAPMAGQTIVTGHSAFGRLADRYGLVVAEVLRPIETTEPRPSQLAAVRDAIRDRSVRAIFVEPQFDGDVARRLAESTSVRLGILDPLGDGDWFAMMERNLASLVEALTPAVGTAVGAAPAATPLP